MKREELKALGIEGDTLEKVMDLHGKDIEKFKSVEAENAVLKEQAKATDASLKELQEKVKGNDELTKKIQEMEAASAKAKSEYESKIGQIKIDNAIDKFLSEKKAKNKVAFRSLLDLEKVTLNEKGEVTGLNEQWDNLYKGNEYMFGEINPAPTKGGNPPQPNSETNQFDGFRNI